MSILQAVPPVPPIPPMPPDPNLMFSSLEPAAVVIIFLALVSAVTLVLWPLARALARRLEAKPSADPALHRELEQMHQRLGEVDALQGRVADLEERLDFAERLLAQSREPDRLQR